jgi:error-prone DNA polymerase
LSELGNWKLEMYIELHARSAFSFLEGTSLPEDLITFCARLNMPAMALLDRNGVYGSPRFHLAAKKIGLKAHIGAEVTWEQLPISSRNQQTTINHQPSKTGNRQLKIENLPRLPLLVASRTGYQNLSQLITRMKLRAAKGEGAVLEHELESHAPGLICLTGGEEGPLAAALKQGGPAEALRTVEHLTQIFGRQNVYVELQRHFHRAEEARNRVAVEIAHALQLPVLATNGVCYASPTERELCDVFTAIRHHRTLMTAGRLLAWNFERHLKSPAEMAELFADLPKAIANTVELSSRLEFTLKDLGYEFPRYPVPEGETMMSFLRQRTDEGARWRYGISLSGTPIPQSGFHNKDLQQRACRQLERELALIERLDLAGYFLIVWDLIRFCREQNILAQGRGSAANSAVCYALGITAVDPVGMELLFERFLSEQRGEWPDIDIDLPSGDQRERVIQYVYQRYGERGAAMTANVITYRNRMAAREMGKAMGFDPETLNKVSAAVATWEFRDANDALDARLRSAGLDLKHPRLRKYFELCLAVQDLPRHLGQHSGGMVICQGQLDSVVPLEPASMPGRVVVQWDKDDCADMGIIKVDLLGLGMMAVLEESLQLIRKHSCEDVDLAHLPPDDPAVYSALQDADTIGLFQVESRAQMSCLPRLRPQCFYDIVVEVAIIRPGPIVGQMVNPYLQRRQGREPVTYPHPSLEPILKRTLGVPLFQEQLLRIAMISANFTGGEAEELRRAMGFKRSQAKMKEIEVRLREGMTQNDISPEAQEQIILSITSFALYGFPESHAASFALIAYASAWLKCHHLAAFTAALLNNQPMGFYHPATLVKDAQRHGLKILPVDVTKSDWLCTLEPVVSYQSSALSEKTVVGKNFVAPASRRLSGGRPARHPAEDTRTFASASQPRSGATGKPGTSVPGTRSAMIAPPSGGATDLSSSAAIEIPWNEIGSYTRSRIAPMRLGGTNSPPRHGDTEDKFSISNFQLPIDSNQQSTMNNPQLEIGNRKSEIAKTFALRLGLKYVRGLRETAAQALIRERSLASFVSIHDLTRRVPELRKDELTTLAEIGALNFVGNPEFSIVNCRLSNHNGFFNQQSKINNQKFLHRRDALWQIERAVHRSGPLLEELPEPDSTSPLHLMTHEERLVADFHGTGLTVGPHPMSYRRRHMQQLGIRRASELKSMPSGQRLRIGGCVITRQRPGTAKGFFFLSLEDETGVANAIVHPDLLQKNRILLISERFLMVEGILQNQDNVISVKAERVFPLRITSAETSSHDFH